MATESNDIKPGDRVHCTDLRRGVTYEVTVEELDGHFAVVRHDNGQRFRVGVGFLNPLHLH